MNKLILFTACCLISLPTWAEDSLEPLMNSVKLQLQAEQWISTKTALVNIIINAAVTDKGIEKIQSEVMNKLNSLSTTNDWHVLSFDRQLDKSGLESIQIIAQARLPQSALANLRDKTKSMSKPGETYSLNSVQFTPSEEEIRLANVNLRNNIYQQTKDEIDTLNKAYPQQKFYLHQIDFQAPPMPMPMMQNEFAATAMRGSDNMTKSAPPLTIGNKAQLQANIVLTSLPDVLLQKIATKPISGS